MPAVYCFMKAIAFNFVPYRVFEFGEYQVDANCVQFLVQINQHFSSRDIHIRDRFGSYQHPKWFGIRLSDQTSHQLAEYIGIGEENRGVPTDHQQAGDLAGIQVSL